MPPYPSQTYQGILVVVSPRLTDRELNKLLGNGKTIQPSDKLPIVLCKHISGDAKAPPAYCIGMAGGAFARRLKDYFAFESLEDAVEACQKGANLINAGTKRKRLCKLGFVELTAPSDVREIKGTPCFERAPEDFEALYPVSAIFSLKGTLGEVLE